MISWVLDHLPWWVFAGVGGALVVAIFVALRAVGFSVRQTWMIAYGAGAAVLAAVLYQKGRNAGVESAQERQKRADAQAVKQRDEIAKDVNARPDEENRERLKRWGRH